MLEFLFIKKKETSESPVFVTITIVCWIICAFACNLSITVTFDTRVEWDFTAQFSKQIFDSSCKLNVRQQLSLPFHKMTYKKRNNPYGLNYIHGSNIKNIKFKYILIRIKCWLFYFFTFHTHSKHNFNWCKLKYDFRNYKIKIHFIV